MRRRQHSKRANPTAALITGASSGIGQAFAREMPEATDLILTGRDEKALSGLVLELRSPDRCVEMVIADLATEQGQEAVVEAASAMSIDLLIKDRKSVV